MLTNYNGKSLDFSQEMPSSDLKSAENSKGWNALLALLSKGILMV